MSLAKQIAHELGDAKQGPDGNWYCLCPIHEDSVSSFSIKDSQNAKPIPVIFECFKDCDRRQIIEEFKRRGWWGDDNRVTSSTKTSGNNKSKPAEPKKEKDFGKFLKEYTEPYHDTDGTVLFESVIKRYEFGKKCSQRRPDGANGWISSLGETKRVLYRLPEILAAVATNEFIFVVEGEECVKGLVEWGLHATTNPMGAGKWKDLYCDYLKGSECVFVLPDYDVDDKGLKHARDVCRSLASAGIPCKLVDLPGMKPKTLANGDLKGTDVKDWKEQGHTSDELLQLCLDAAPWVEKPAEQDFVESFDSDGDDVDESALPSFRRAIETLGLGEMIYTDTANGRRLIKLYGEDLKYTKSNGWLIWDGTRWKPDPMDRIVELAKDSAAKILDERKILPKVSHKKLRLWAERSLQAGKLRNMIELSKSDCRVAADINDFDSNPWLLNCANGVVDVRSMDIIPHDRALMCSKQVPFAFDPMADCPVWLSFLDRVMDGDWDMMRFLQRAAGISLTGYLIPEIFMVFGSGRNGKSIFLNTLLHIAGDYGTSVRAKAFMKKFQESQVDSLGQLIGARFVGVNEIGEGDKLDEESVKDWTGGEMISFKKLFHDAGRFRPSGKLWFRGNYLPDIKGTDDGIWGRMRRIDFSVTIPEEERDPLLQEKLYGEVEGILAWAIMGGYEFCQTGENGRMRGLEEPEKVLAATMHYKQNMDTIGQFLEACCGLMDKSASEYEDAILSCTLLHAAYDQWSKKNGHAAYKQKRFGAYMTQKGFDRKRINGREYYKGMRLRAEYYPQGESSE